MIVRTIVAAVAVAAALSGQSSAFWDELPDLYHSGTLLESWPAFHLDAIDIGTDEATLFDVVGITAPRDAKQSEDRSRCIAFAYDERASLGGDRFLNVLVVSGKVRDRWLSNKAFSRAECSTLLNAVVDLTDRFFPCAADTVEK